MTWIRPESGAPITLPAGARTAIPTRCRRQISARRTTRLRLRRSRDEAPGDRAGVKRSEYPVGVHTPVAPEIAALGLAPTL
jgi:hypothetical protein